MIISILNALAAIPAIAGYVQSAIQAIIGWYMARQTTDTLAAIANAADLGARAQTDQDRYVAAQTWQNALSRTRIINDSVSGGLAASYKRVFGGWFWRR